MQKDKSFESPSLVKEIQPILAVESPELERFTHEEIAEPYKHDINNEFGQQNLMEELTRLQA
jgi:hypothetical protein